MFGRKQKFEIPVQPNRDDDNPFSGNRDTGDSDPFSSRSSHDRSYADTPSSSSFEQLASPSDDPFGLSSDRNTGDSAPYEANGRSFIDRMPMSIRKIVAAGTISLAAAGIGVPTAAFTIDHMRGGDSRETSTTVAELGTEKPLDLKVQQDITEALTHDTCETKVTPDQVTDTYHQLFDHELPSDLSLEDFTSLVQGQSHQIEELREKGGYAKLPTNYQELQDKLNTNEIPVSTYQQTLAAYLQDNFGVSTEYTIGKEDPLRYQVDGISQEKLNKEFAGSFKALSLNIIQDTRNIAPELIRQSIQRFVFGDVRIESAVSGEGAGGFFNKNSRAIVFDLATAQENTDTNEVAAHELTHSSDAALCEGVAWKYIDTAFESLNGDIKYGDSTYHTLTANGRTPEGISALLPQDPRTAHSSVELAQAYGAANGREDRATVGELAFSPDNMVAIFQTDGTVVLKEKIALLTTRADTDASLTTEFTAAQMQSAQVEAALTSRIQALQDEFFQLRSSKGYDGSKHPDVINKQNELKQYEDQLALLKEARSGVPNAR